MESNKAQLHNDIRSHEVFVHWDAYSDRAVKVNESYKDFMNFKDHEFGSHVTVILHLVLVLVVKRIMKKQHLTSVYTRMFILAVGYIMFIIA